MMADPLTPDPPARPFTAEDYDNAASVQWDARTPAMLRQAAESERALARVREAAAKVLEGFDSGVFVRNWAMFDADADVLFLLAEVEQSEADVARLTAVIEGHRAWLDREADYDALADLDQRRAAPEESK